MPAIGVDCEIILDGTGYFIKPLSYTVKIPRISRESYRADSNLAYVDLGPGRCTWSMIILALNELKHYDGTTSPMTGQQYRDALRASYSSHIGSSINFTDPLSGVALPVYFTSYEERIPDLRTQIITRSTGGAAGASYEIQIELVAA